MILDVIQSGPFTTIQDAGRFGYQRAGIPPSGAMDLFALQAANRLVGNMPGAAAIEIGFADTALLAREACLIAVTGAGFDLFVQTRPMPLWTTIFVRGGWAIELRRRTDAIGCWAYLALAGGITTPPVLGSRSTFGRAQLGGYAGRALQPGDEIPVGSAPASLLEKAGRHVPVERRPYYSDCPTVHVIPGPQSDHFSQAGQQTFLASEYRVSMVADRMGYRLEGPSIEHSGGADIISDGLVRGSIQVSASGQPLVMMADRPTTGGYPKIATVISADLPLVAQCVPGSGRVRFQAITVEAAQNQYRQTWGQLESGVVEPELDGQGWIAA